MRTLPTPNARVRRRRRLGVATGVVAVAASGLAIATSGAAVTPHPGQRVDMKVLLLANTAGDADITAWEDNLKREGTPYTRINGGTPLTAATFAAGERAKYQAVIVAGANGTQPTGRPDGFSDAEWALLRAFESRFAIRQLNVNAVPGPPLGLGFATAAGALDGSSAVLTPEGRAQFENLAGTVDFENLDSAVSETLGSGASPCNAADAACAAASYETLLRGGGTFNDTSLVGIAKMKDGRQEMNATFSGNQNQLHTQILRNALLNWVTGGVYIGVNRGYLAIDVDDLFVPDQKWDPTVNGTPGDGVTIPTATAPEVGLRMTAADVGRLIAFQNANNVKLNMLFNGSGVGDYQGANGGVDPTFDAFMANKTQFSWISHTWSHLSLGSPDPESPTLAEPGAKTPTQAEIRAEIEQNKAFATTNALPGFDGAQLTTGGHSGIGTSNPVTPPTTNMAAALNAAGVTTVGADNSREVGQRRVGNAYTLPRYPTNMFYNVSTWTDQLDEYDWLYLAKTDPSGRGNCTNTTTTTCFASPVTQAQFIQRESTAIVRRLLGNDPRPSYVHQSNAISDPNAATPVANRGDGILQAVLGRALADYRRYVSTQFQQPGMTTLREVLRRQIAWGATTAGQVSGYIEDGKVVLDSTVSREVPLTGTTVGDVYGGRRSGWRAVTPGITTLDLDQASVVTAPVISGATAVGSTLAAASGTYTGTPPPTVTSRQWQRRSRATGSAPAGAWADIPGATAATYQLTAADVGRDLRHVETASNVLSAWGMGLSAPFAVVVPPVLPPGGGPGPTTGPPSLPPSSGPPVAPGDTTTPPAASGPIPAPLPAPFTCTVKRAKKVVVSCRLRNASGTPRTARIRAVRGRKNVVGIALGPVRGGSRLPVLGLRRTVLKHDTRITVTVKLANGRTRTVTRTLKV